MDQPNLAKYLFVGGSRDGQWVDVPIDQRIAELRVLGEKKVRGRLMPTEIYRKLRFTGETLEFYIFALDGVSGNTVLHALIQNYRPEK